MTFFLAKRSCFSLDLEAAEVEMLSFSSTSDSGPAEEPYVCRESEDCFSVGSRVGEIVTSTTI